VADMSHSSPICGTVSGHRRSRLVVMLDDPVESDKNDLIY
jgi:hypothetical protein